MPLCPSCCSEKTINKGKLPNTDYFSGRVRDVELDGNELYECNVCRLYFRYPILPKKQLDWLYKTGVSSNWQSDFGNREDWNIIIRELKVRVKKGKVLDVGCFDGQLLSLLSKSYDVAGVEIHEEASARAKSNGIRILANNYDELEHSEEKFDVVISTDVIEHTKNPYIFLKSLSAAASDNAIIIIGTGNSHSVPWRLLGNKYSYCAIAEHVSFLNPDWCKWAASKLDLSVLSTIKYSHRKVSFFKHCYGIAINLLYWGSPKLLFFLRALGLGNVDVAERPSMKEYPPAWHGAVDHFITIFRKN